MKRKNIESYIIEGAGYFLNSNTDFLLFLTKIERSELNGIDYNELRATLNRVIENMEKAKSLYTSLVQTAANTPSKQSFIEGLKIFDYVGYQNQSALNSIIFQDTVSFLKNGDITGLFAKILGRTAEILDRLYIAKKDIDAEIFPSISNIWRLNQCYNETVLFGQYAAEIFARIN
ncbi:MAG: hypothetical protein MUF15_25690 [Acidobacteria bacterium]|nr:hypothetical protein [Acidobacteriota bacterium]